MKTDQEIEARRLELEIDLGSEVTVDKLSAGWCVYQRRRGHRYSTDDLTTAWFGASHQPTATRLLDLGSGLGSVGLFVLWRQLQNEAIAPSVRLTTIEAQEQSFKLQLANHWMNGVEDRVNAHQGDLRSLHAGAYPIAPGSFDLVTGSPPYFETDKAIVSADSQRAHARFELRGDVSDYCVAASYALAPQGRFAFCLPTGQRDKALRGIARGKLTLVAYQDVIPMRGRAPLFSLYLCARPGDVPAGQTAQELAPLIVRETDNKRTDQMNDVLSFFAIPLRN